jgi:hypothetical protein
MSELKTTTEWLRANTAGETIGVDRNEAVIRGYIVAQEGPFKSEGRGEFDKPALRQIVKLMRATPNGLKSRFAHPSLSDDGIGKFLGRVRSPRMDTISVRESEGVRKDDEINIVRGDLYLDPSSRNTPNGDLGGYVMDLASSDPDALSSSLVLRADKEYRFDGKGRPKMDTEGNELPPLWHPTHLHASDVVDAGDAVDGFLSAEAIDGLPDAIVRRGAELIDKQFPDASREEIDRRCHAWLRRYLVYRFGEESGLPALGDPYPYDPARDAEKERIRRMVKKRIERSAIFIPPGSHTDDLT